MPSRRKVLKTIAATSLALQTKHLFAKEVGVPESNSADRIDRIIKEYSEQGIHRSGTEGDLASAEWFKNQIANLGVTPAEDRFSFKRINVQRAELVLSDTVVEGIPLYDCTYTTAEGVVGRLGELGSDAEIGVVMALPHLSTAGGQALLKARKEGSHTAILVVTDARMPPGITLFNAEDFNAPFGPPVLQISSKRWSTLEEARDAGAEAQLIAQCNYVDAAGVNVLASIKGSDAGLAPLVIMTPRSGWWACASERGGGIACLLEMMRAIQLAGPVRDVHFTANTGHELGHIGLDHYLKPRQELLQEAHMWIHLGANFATKMGPGIRLQYSDEEAKSLLSDALSSRGLKPAGETELGTRPLGEARNIHDHEGRYISILGRNALFHHPADVWPDSVDLATTTKWVGAFTELGVALSS
jgi:hypothetical protein